MVLIREKLNLLKVFQEIFFSFFVGTDSDAGNNTKIT